MTLLRELGRRKLRTTLTVLGITIGIWALVVFSSMANKINSFVASGSDYYAGKVLVSDGVEQRHRHRPRARRPRASPTGSARWRASRRSIPRCRSPTTRPAPAGSACPRIIVGAVAGADEGLGSRRPAARGRATADRRTTRDRASPSWAATWHGSWMPPSARTRVLRGVSFEVVGILQPTLSAPDTTAMVPLAAAQELFLASLPPPLGSALDAGELASRSSCMPRTARTPRRSATASRRGRRR